MTIREFVATVREYVGELPVHFDWQPTWDEFDITGLKLHMKAATVGGITRTDIFRLVALVEIETAKFDIATETAEQMWFAIRKAFDSASDRERGGK